MANIAATGVPSSKSRALPTPSGFVCPLARQLMLEPVAAADGRVYERAAIENWFQQGQHVSPVDGEQLRTLDLTPHEPLRVAIAEYLRLLPTATSGDRSAEPSGPHANASVGHDLDLQKPETEFTFCDEPENEFCIQRCHTDLHAELEQKARTEFRSVGQNGSSTKALAMLPVLADRLRQAATEKGEPELREEVRRVAEWIETLQSCFASLAFGADAAPAHEGIPSSVTSSVRLRRKRSTTPRPGTPTGSPRKVGPKMVLNAHTGTVLCIAYLGHERLASGSLDTTARLWDITTGLCIGELKGHEMAVTALASSGARQLATGSRDSTVRLWRLSDNACRHVFKGHRRPVTGLATLSDNRLASSSADKTARIWHTSEKTCLYVLEGHKDYVNGILELCWGSIATVSDDCTMRLWDASSGGSRLSVMHPCAVLSVASVTGCAATGAADFKVRIFNSGGEMLKSLEGHTGWVLCLSPLGKDCLVSGSGDKSVRIWEVSSGTEVATLNETTSPSGSDGNLDVVFAVQGVDFRVLMAVGRVVQVWHPG